MLCRRISAQHCPSLQVYIKSAIRGRDEAERSAQNARFEFGAVRSKAASIQVGVGARVPVGCKVVVGTLLVPLGLQAAGLTQCRCTKPNIFTLFCVG